MIGSWVRHRLRHFAPMSLRLFEWDQADVLRKRLSNSPDWALLTKPLPDLRVTGWGLAHAVVKADFLVPRSLLLPGIGFLLHIDEVIDFSSSSNLRLRVGGARTFNDFTQTGTIGRIGQGLSLLFANDRQYRFVGHLESDPIVATYPKGKVADFLFETAAGDRVILESKATCNLDGNDPSRVKRVLKTALSGQVTPWMRRLVPPAAKGFALYSCLRESGCAEDSAITFVDPIRQRIRSPVELPKSWVRRRNFAAWLTAMGLGDVARRLRQEDEGSAREVVLPTFKIEDRCFAVAIDVCWPPDPVGTGIEVEGLNAIEKAIGGSESALMAYEPADPELNFYQDRAGYSIFPDGTFIGTLKRKSFSGFASFRL